jgi:hypothetical protein
MHGYAKQYIDHAQHPTRPWDRRASPNLAEGTPGYTSISRSVNSAPVASMQAACMSRGVKTHVQHHVHTRTMSVRHKSCSSLSNRHCMSMHVGLSNPVGVVPAAPVCRTRGATVLASQHVPTERHACMHVPVRSHEPHAHLFLSRSASRPYSAASAAASAYTRSPSGLPPSIPKKELPRPHDISAPPSSTLDTCECVRCSLFTVISCTVGLVDRARLFHVAYAYFVV